MSSSSILPASILEKSRISLSTDKQRSAELAESAIRAARPRAGLQEQLGHSDDAIHRGADSCDILARNWLFARFASSAASSRKQLFGHQVTGWSSTANADDSGHLTVVTQVGENVAE